MCHAGSELRKNIWLFSVSEAPKDVAEDGKATSTDSSENEKVLSKAVLIPLRK